MPRFKLLIAANDAPIIRDDDDACWSRVRRIPFCHSVAPEHQDKQLREKLTTPDSLSAIFVNWGVTGAQEWLANGLGSCAKVEASVAEYRAEMDRAAGFVVDYLEFYGTYRCAAKELHEAYDVWCRDNGIKKPLTGNELGKRLTAKGAIACRSHGRNYWAGVRVAVAGDGGDGGCCHSPEVSHGRNSMGNFSEMASPGSTASTREDVIDETEYQAEFAWRGDK